MGIARALARSGANANANVQNRQLNMRVLILITVLVAFSLSLGGCAQSPRYLRVLQTSDVHGYYGAPEEEGAHEDAGGRRQLASLLDDERSTKKAVLLVDSGDMWSGTQLSDRNEGALGVVAYNALGVWPGVTAARGRTGSARVAQRAPR